MTRSGNQRRFGGWGLKKIHRAGESLMVRCLRDGTLDVCLKTGRVFSTARGRMKRLKTREDEDGYRKLTLSRESKTRRKKDSSGRRREHMTVFIHRLVMVKKIAVAANPDRWRDIVRDLHGGTDVHHKDHNKTNNVADNLTLELAELHRAHAAECFAVAEDF